MKKILRNLLTLTALLCCSAAQAQFSGSVDQEIWEDSYGDASLIEFSLTEVASALNTDTATLVAALDAESEAFYDAEDVDVYYESVATNDVRFQVLVNGGQYVYPQAGYGYTQGYWGGFWMLEDCTPCSWGVDDMAFYNYPYWDAEEDVFYIALGQAPGYFSVGDYVTANFLLYVNGSSVNFEVTLNIVEAEVVEIDNDTILSNLTIVKEAEVSVEQYQRSSYTADEVEIELSGLAELLGTTASELSNYFSYHVYVRSYDEDNGVWSDELNNEFTATEPGFWFTPCIDEDTGESALGGECFSTDYGSSSVFFIESLAFDEDEDVLSFTLGQYPGNCNVDSTYWSTLYIVNGTNAASVKISLTILESETVDFSEMTMAGSEWQQVVIEAEYEDATMIEVDMDSICELLGIDSGDYSYYAFASEGVLTNSSTANNGGYWFNSSGYVCSYGASNCAMYIEPYSTSYLNYLNVGQYVFTEIEEGDSLTCSLIVLGTTTYYQIDVNLKVEPAVEKDSVDVDEWYIAYTIEESIQLIPDDDDYELETYEMDLDAILKYTELDALDSKCLYTWASSYDGSSWDPSDLTNDYSCTPYPGFWMSPDGTYNYGYSSACAYGMTFTYGTGEIIFYNYPGANEVGDSYTSYFYIVNVENGKCVQLLLDIEFVEEIVEITDAGEEDVVILLSSENEDGLPYADNDLSTMFDAIGIEAELYDSGTWYVPVSSSRYTRSDDFETIETVGFDEDGYTVDFDSEDCVFTLWYDPDYQQFVVSYIADANEETLATTTVYYRYDYSRYYFNITIAGSEEALGIGSVSSDESTSGLKGTYDLSGRRLSDSSTLAKGLYIIDGQKVLIK